MEKRKSPPAAEVESGAGFYGVLSGRDAWLVLALLVVVSYIPALSGGFVWDDVIFSEEPLIRKASGLWNIWFSPGDLKEGHYWPLVYTSFWLEHQLWGLAPAGYHAVNVLLHLANVLLLWRLLERLAVPGALAIAAVFAVHPLHVESVAWLIERKDVLSGLFYLAAVLAWIRFTEAPRAGGYVLALVLLVAGLLSKSVVVTLPAALLIWHWWQHGRVTRTDLLRLAPFVAVAAGITAADLSFYASREPLDLGYTLAERVLIASRALWFYVGKLLWPTELAVIYPLWEIDAGDPLAWGYVGAAAALAAVLWLGRRRLGRGPLAGALYFAVTLGPVLGFVDYGYMQFSFVADRFQYLAGIGVLAVLIGAAAHGAGRLPRGFQTAACGLAVVVVGLLGALTWRQAGIYQNEVTFFSHVVALNPAARHMHSNLGRALLRQGQLEEAEAHLLHARQRDPRDVNAHQNLAEAFRKQERYAEAVASFRAALEINPDNALAHAGMGMSLFKTQHYDEALEAMQKAVALEPDLPTQVALRVHMGRAARELGRLDDAAAYLQRVMETEPRNAEALFDLVDVRVMQQRHEEADQLLQRARRSRPRDPETLHNVAEALRKQGRYEEAVATYRAALEIGPESASVHAGMGIALFQWERYEEAITALEQAVALQPDLPVMGSSLHVFLGRALQGLGRTEAAAEQYERAVQADPHNTEALDYLAMTRFGQQQYEAALEGYRAMIEIDPDNAQTHSNLGAALHRLGRLEEALVSIERALALDPDQEMARLGLEQVREALQRRGE